MGKLGPRCDLFAHWHAAPPCARGHVIDGPFAETKEQLLGFYVIDVEISLDAQRWTVAKDFPPVIPPASIIPPIALYVPEPVPTPHPDDQSLLRIMHDRSCLMTDLAWISGA